MRIKTWIMVILIAASCATATAQEALNNDSIIRMHAAGLSDAIIVSSIHSAAGAYRIAPDDLIALKRNGISDTIIEAMMAKPRPSAQPAYTPAPPPPPVATQPAAPVTYAPAAQPAYAPPAQPVYAAPPPQQPVYAAPQQRQEPRIFLQARSRGNNVNAVRDQSMEMSKDFDKDCPNVRISIVQDKADYTVLLNHIEMGAFDRDNQFEVANRNGDLIRRSEGSSIDKGVKGACTAILSDWATRAR